MQVTCVSYALVTCKLPILFRRFPYFRISA
nr:MAG TPA: hypothetical protein [Caudoviricetes sp.]